MSYRFASNNKNIALLENNKVIKHFKVIKSLQNKIDIIIQDLNDLTQEDGFIDFILTFDKLLQKEFIKETQATDTILYYAKKLVDMRVQDLSEYCDYSKRTKSSIFFDEEMVYKLLLLTAVFKIIAPYLHGEEYKDIYQHQLQELLRDITSRFDDIFKQLYQIIRSKVLRGSMNDKKFMSFLKYSLSYDYLILYNYSFITTVLLCTYNWKTNPISFIVSLASDNFRYLVLTYSTLPLNYTSEEFQEVSHDYMKTLSYEMIINTILDKLNKSGVSIKGHLFPTPVTESVVIPIMSYVLDIPSDYLRNKPIPEKLQMQYLFSKFLAKTKFAKNNKESWKAIQPFLNYAFTIPVQRGGFLLPAFLEVLKEKFTYYGLESKSLALEMLKSFSVMSNKAQYLRNIVDESAFPHEVKKKIQNHLKELSKFIVYIIQDGTREEIRADLKLAFLEYMGHVKLTKQAISLYLY